MTSTLEAGTASASVLPTSRPSNNDGVQDSSSFHPPRLKTWRSIRGPFAITIPQWVYDWMGKQFAQLKEILRRPDQQTYELWKEEIFNVEFVYRYSIVSSRLQVLQHRIEERVTGKDPAVGDIISPEIVHDLSQYTQDMRDYRFFRSEGRDLFSTENGLKAIVAKKMLLQEAEATLANAAGLDDTGTGARIDNLRKEITEDFRKALRQTTSGMTRKKHRRRKSALWARVSMALGGGFALVVPMIIMVLHPTKLTAMLTTSLFVIAVAVFLAVFMSDSQPKDVVACTVAYAAVLVVFVGAGGGT